MSRAGKGCGVVCRETSSRMTFWNFSACKSAGTFAVCCTDGLRVLDFWTEAATEQPLHWWSFSLFLEIFQLDEGIYWVVLSILVPVRTLHQWLYFLPTFCSPGERCNKIPWLCHSSDCRGVVVPKVLAPSVLVERLIGAFRPQKLPNRENNFLRYICFLQNLSSFYQIKIVLPCAFDSDNSLYLVCTWKPYLDSVISVKMNSILMLIVFWI